MNFLLHNTGFVGYKRRAAVGRIFLQCPQDTKYTRPLYNCRCFNRLSVMAYNTSRVISLLNCSAVYPSPWIANVFSSFAISFAFVANSFVIVPFDNSARMQLHRFLWMLSIGWASCGNRISYARRYLYIHSRKCQYLYGRRYGNDAVL